MRTALKIAVLVFMLAGITMLTACKEKKDKPVFAVDGMEILVGTTTMKEMEEAGFEIYENFASSAVIEISAMGMDGLNAASMVCYGKNRVPYGYLTIANSREEHTPLEQCKVFEIDASYESAQSITLNGETYEGISPTDLKKKLGKADEDSMGNATTGQFLQYEMEDCAVSYYFDEETERLKKINIRYDFNVEFSGYEAWE